MRLISQIRTRNPAIDSKMMNRPGFFKLYLPKSSRTQMLIPTPFIMCIGGVLPETVFLRDRFDNMWQVKVGKVAENWYFQKGPNQCETAGAGGLLPNGPQSNDEDVEDEKKDGEDETDDYYSENDDGLSVKQEPWSEGDEDNQSDDSLFVKQEPKSEADDDDDEKGDNVFVEKEHPSEGDDGYDDDRDDYDDDDDNDNENRENMFLRLLPQTSAGNGDTESDDNAFVKKEPPRPIAAADDDDGYEEEETEDADYMLIQEKEHEEYASKPANNAGNNGKQASLYPKYYGMEIFEAGLASRPKNPYFVAQLSPKRKGDLFIPTELIKDYNLELPKPEMLLVDPHGRVFHAKYKKWKDGRTLYSKGWRGLWKMNCITKNDICICEFKQGKNGLYLKVDIIYANGRPP